MCMSMSMMNGGCMLHFTPFHVQRTLPPACMLHFCRGVREGLSWGPWTFGEEAQGARGGLSCACGLLIYRYIDDREITKA